MGRRREEVASVLERISVARESRNLKLNYDKLTDLDVLTALGFATRAANPAAGPLMNLHLAMDQTALEDAYSATVKLVRRMNIRKRWGFSQAQDIEAIAKHAIRYYINPVCPICHGRKFELRVGTPMLSDRPCDKCGGTGRRPFPMKKGEFIKATVTAIEAIEQRVEVEVSKRLFWSERQFREYGDE